jgi:Rieske Fe-S protein
MADDHTSMGLDNGRRNFLNWFLATTAGAFIVSVLYPLSRYLIPPKVEESTARTVPLSV